MQHLGHGAAQITRKAQRQLVSPFELQAVTQTPRLSTGSVDIQASFEHASLDMNRQGGIGRLAQRLGQIQRQPLQAAVKLPTQSALCRIEQQGIAAAAGGMGQGLAHAFELGGLAQAFGAELPVHAKLALGWPILKIKPPLQLHLTAQGLGLHIGQGKTGFAERQSAPGFAQTRHLRHQLQLIARQNHRALHFAAGHLFQGQCEFEAQLGRANGLRFRQDLIGPVGHRGLGHHPQHLVQTAFDGAAGRHHRVVKVGQAHLHRRRHQGRTGWHSGSSRRAHQLRRVGTHHQALPLEIQLRVDLAQQRPLPNGRPCQRGGHQIHGTVFDLGLHLEQTAPVVLEGEVVQTALQLKLRLGDAAGRQAVFHILAGVCRQALGQIAGHLPHLATGQAALQIQHPRQALRQRRIGLAVVGVPVQSGLPFEVGIGQRQLGHLQADFLPLFLNLPFEQSLQLGDGNLRLVKKIGQRQRTGAQAQSGLPLVLVGVQNSVQTLHTRHPIGGLPGDPFELGIQFELGRQRVGIAQPSQVHRFELSFWRKRLHLLLQFGRHGHPHQQGAQSGHIDLIRTQLPMRQPMERVRMACLARLPMQGHPPPRPTQTIGRLEGQPIGIGIHPGAQALPAQTPLQPFQVHHGQVFAPLHLHLGHGQIDHPTADLTLGQIGPETQSPVALGQVTTQVQIGPQRLHIDPVKIGIHRALPGLPMAPVRVQQGLPKITQDRKTVAPTGRRADLDTHTVANGGIADQQIDLVKHHRCQRLLFVGPNQGAVGHRHAGLRGQPIGHAFIAVGGGHAQTRNFNVPRHRAAHIQGGGKQGNALKTQAQQGPGGQGQFDLRQAQGHPPLAVQQGHLVQIKGRHPT